jgi:DNA-binding Lrp family transcriptional regulator
MQLFHFTARAKALSQIKPDSRERTTMNCVFIQLRCAPGSTYKVADAIYDRELVSEMYSTSGEFDLLIKLYVPEGEDIGKYINDKLLNIPGISRSLTTLTFKAF